MTFPSDTNKTQDFKNFLKMILCKKVNQRNCSFRKLKVSEYFDNFKWDEMIDFRMKPPFLPETLDLTKSIQNFTNNYEIIIQVYIIYPATI
jgi:hypothetical protein